jgi:hypothetical protein
MVLSVLLVGCGSIDTVDDPNARGNVDGKVTADGGDDARPVGVDAGTAVDTGWPACPSVSYGAKQCSTQFMFIGGSYAECWEIKNPPPAACSAYPVGSADWIGCVEPPLVGCAITVANGFVYACLAVCPSGTR